MARTRRLKKVTFMSRGKKVYFLAKRGAAVAYQKSKPYAKSGARAAYRGAKLTSRYSAARMNAYIAKQQKSSKKPRSKTTKAKPRNTYARTRLTTVKCSFCAELFSFGGSTGKTRSMAQKEIYQHLRKYHSR